MFFFLPSFLLPAKDFISSLMEKDPAKRFTCELALRHPWWETAALAQKLTRSNTKAVVKIRRADRYVCLCVCQDRRGYGALQEHPWVSEPTDQEELCQEQMEGKHLSQFIFCGFWLCCCRRLACFQQGSSVVYLFRSWIIMRLNPGGSAMCAGVHRRPFIFA